MVKGICVLGSTGSIGTQTLNIIERFPESYYVTALTAGKNLTLLREQIRKFNPAYVCVLDDKSRYVLAAEFPQIAFGYGEAGVIQAVKTPGSDVIVVGIVGFAALSPTLEAIRLNKRIALANKESLVVAGHLMNAETRRSGAEVIPVDSEHNALFQLLEGRRDQQIQSLVLTASGGPLLRRPELPLEDVTPALAIAHPNWKMGPKISVDSATLMNKGLELIEACRLFDVPQEKIEVWIHPQSIVHGAIWFEDNSCLAQLSKPDMRSSIGYALSYPRRIPAVIPKLTMQEMSRLEFSEPDNLRFPALLLARQALQSGPSHVVALNAANEVFVQAFLDGKLLFPQMATCIEEVLNRHLGSTIDDIPAVFEVDSQARAAAVSVLSGCSVS